MTTGGAYDGARPRVPATELRSHAVTSQLWDVDRQRVWHPYTGIDTWEAGPCPVVITGAEGVWLHTAHDGALLDAVGSWWVSALGHRHPRVSAALHAQLDQMHHVFFAGALHEPGVLLAQRLVAVAPPGLARVFYSDNGSTALEVALRAAFQFHAQNGAPARQTFVSFQGAYHGDTIGTVSIGGIARFHALYQPLLFRSEQLPAPSDDQGNNQEATSLAALDELLARSGNTVAAVVVEPLIQGAAGMRMHSPAWLAAVAARVKAAGALLIVDEVFTGFGRTGTLFASEQAELRPDFLCLSKGLSGGSLPFAATVTTDAIYDGFRGDASRTFFYGHSYCGNPLGCAAALAVLDAFAHDGILEGLPIRIQRMADHLAQIQELPGVACVRQTGLVGAIQLGAHGAYEAPDGWAVAAAARPLGVLLRPLGNVVVLAPALTISMDELDFLMDTTRAAIAQAMAAQSAPRSFDPSLPIDGHT